MNTSQDEYTCNCKMNICENEYLWKWIPIKMNTCAVGDQLNFLSLRSSKSQLVQRAHSYDVTMPRYQRWQSPTDYATRVIDRDVLVGCWRHVEVIVTDLIAGRRAELRLVPAEVRVG